MCSIILEEGPFIQSEAEKKLVKKINYIFMPFVCLILFTQYVDKSTLTVIGVIDEFFTDAGITKDQYAWLVSKYAGTCLVIWSTVLLSMAWGKNFSQFAALRFLLGFFEAITYPAIFLLIATIYRKSEQVIWLGVMFISNSVGAMLGGFAGVGIIKMPTVGKITPRKWAFIIFGSITVLMGLIYIFFLPDKPTSRWFRLTEEEKVIVEERIRDNAVVPTPKINYDQIREALKEPRLYCCCLISCLNTLQNGVLTLFTGIIISGMGYSSTDAILLTIPTGVCTIIIISAATNISKKEGEIIGVAIVTCTISLICLLCLTVIPSGGVKLIGLYLQSGGTATYVLLQASITSNISGLYQKDFLY